MKQVQSKWFASAIGRLMNPDRMYGYQCKDTVDDYCQAIFGRPWSETVRPGDGRQVFANASINYFTKVANNFNDPGQLPPKGSILSYAGSRAVPEGHTAVTLEATRTGVWVIQQDGYKQVAAHKAFLPYDGLIGWLIPKPDKVLPDPKPAAAATQLRTVTASVANVRTAPRVNAPKAPGYPNGLAKGAKLAVVGYVAGQDPYPNDGALDNAWYKTKSGYYVWANAAGNSLAGLRKL